MKTVSSAAAIKVKMTLFFLNIFSVHQIIGFDFYLHFTLYTNFVWIGVVLQNSSKHDYHQIMFNF